MTQSLSGVLLVEDDEGDAILVRECLRESGLDDDDVTWCRTVAEGVAALASEPSCILLDLGLPDAEGLSALHTVIAEVSTTPVIVLTGRHGRVGIEAVAAGAQDYLIKDDLTPELLDRTIRYAVQRRQTQLTEVQLSEERLLAAENSRLERGLLPKPLLRTGFVSCASHYRPGRARAVLGGDFYDVVELPDGRVRAVIGDVMGHGPDEAALGVHLRVAWRALVLAEVAEDQILVALARLLEAESPGGIFVTVCDVTIDRDLGLTVRVAGHPPPLVCAGGEASYLDVAFGPPLGIRDEAPHRGWPVTRAQLEQGSALVLYTDGLLDAYRQVDSLTSVGLDELLEIAAGALTEGEPLDDLLETIVARAPVRAVDDTALVVLRVGGAGGRGARLVSARAWSLRRRVTRAIVGVLVLQLALVVTVLYFINDAKNAGDELVEQWDPAYTISQNTMTAMVNEETGVRGYALGRDEAFLEPYDLAQLLGSSAQSTLRKYLLDYPDLLGRLRELDAAIDAWHTTVAEPIIAQVRAGDASAAQAAAAPEARAAFDRIRVASNLLTQGIDDERTEVADDRERAFTWVWVVVGLGAAVLLVTGLVLGRGLRRQVLHPMSGLVTQTRQVAAGNLDLEIAQDGPLEIQNLASDVELMRETMAAQIERIERSRVRIQHRSAELARSNSDLEQFAYVASHDLSEPLRKVTNFCQLLERQYADQLDDKARLYIGFMVDGAKRMQALINDLLDFSRVGRSHEHFVQVDLEVALARALTNLEEPITLAQAVVDHDPLPTVPGEPALLTALLQNLVGNAVKYHSPDRPCHVRISVEEQGDDWLLTVDDNGIGVEPQYADRIFTIFQRLHLRDQYGGTGIGLALCRRILDFHSGRIWLAEKADPGARFHFTLPQTQALSETVDDDEPAQHVAS